MNNEQDSTFEARLRGLRPRAPAIDRDRLMFQAGQSSARRANRLWPGLAVASWAACAALAGVLIWRPVEVVSKTRVVERVVRVPVEHQSVPSEPKRRENDRPVGASWRQLAEVREESLWSLDRVEGPLTAGAWQEWRNGDFRAVASVQRSPSTGRKSRPASSPPKTYGELRREMMGRGWDGRVDVF